MPKNKRPAPRKKPPQPVEEDDDVLAQAMADLALIVAEQQYGGDPEIEADLGLDPDPLASPEDLADPHVLAQKDAELTNLIRNALRKKNDEALYGAIERARFTDIGAYQLLRARVEEAAGTLLLRRADGAHEIDAFALPVFVHSTGGLKRDQDFTDGDAFEALVASFSGAGIESVDAKVVMLNHGFDLAEVDRITYSMLQEMVRDAAGSMTEKKLVPRPALERSMSGWAESGFGPDDPTVELRFLVGFSLKREDDPFYEVPADDIAAETYFEQRMERYRAWTVQAAPLVKRCLATDPATIEVHFLYQDLFFGAKEQGLAEMATLQLMSSINAALEASGAAPDSVRAVVGPADVDDDMVLRVNLYGADGQLLASTENPLDLGADLLTEVDDVCDALSTVGIAKVQVCMRFDAQGQPVEAQDYV